MGLVCLLGSTTVVAKPGVDLCGRTLFTCGKSSFGVCSQTHIERELRRADCSHDAQPSEGQTLLWRATRRVGLAGRQVHSP
jgi:hypothetical protein